MYGARREFVGRIHLMFVFTLVWSQWQISPIILVPANYTISHVL